MLYEKSKQRVKKNSKWVLLRFAFALEVLIKRIFLMASRQCSILRNLVFWCEKINFRNNVIFCFFAFFEFSKHTFVQEILREFPFNSCKEFKFFYLRMKLQS